MKMDIAAKYMSSPLKILRVIPNLRGSIYTPTRGLASETPIPAYNNGDLSSSLSTSDRPIAPSPPKVLTTLYSFPRMEPQRFEYYPENHLYLPLRRDILHRAVIYEGDGTRQGTASTKWRKDVAGSGKKIRPQKGTGMARLGDKKSPMLRGGGVAHGPHPRDFSTDLPRKMYDLAWRTALSYRYKKGELIIIGDKIQLRPRTPVKHRWPEASKRTRVADAAFLTEVFEANHWGAGNGRSIVITANRNAEFFGALEQSGQARALTESEVDVKNLLEMGRVIIEKRALDSILQRHQSDLR